MNGMLESEISLKHVEHVEGFSKLMDLYLESEVNEGQGSQSPNDGTPGLTRSPRVTPRYDVQASEVRYRAMHEQLQADSTNKCLFLFSACIPKNMLTESDEYLLLFFVATKILCIFLRGE